MGEVRAIDTNVKVAPDVAHRFKCLRAVPDLVVERLSVTPRPIDEWHEDIGPVMWWRFPIEEPPYIGSPLDCGQTVEVVARFYERGAVMEKLERYQVGGWPGYHTHWTPIIIPLEPAP